jgi:hypothetical protein
MQTRKSPIEFLSSSEWLQIALQLEGDDLAVGLPQLVLSLGDESFGDKVMNIQDTYIVFPLKSQI